MNHKKLGLIATFLFVGMFVNAQKIMMKIPNVTVPAGEEISALEFKIDAETTFLTGPGAAVGKPIPSSVLIKKKPGPSTNYLFKAIAKGTSTPYITFEYYDKQNVLYYVITLGGGTIDATLNGVFVNELRWLSPECPTCIALEHQIGFVMKGVIMEDKINNLRTTWNISTLIVN